MQVKIERYLSTLKQKDLGMRRTAAEGEIKDCEVTRCCRYSLA